MSSLIRLNLDHPPILGGCTVFELDKERLEYVQPGAWYQLLFHRFPATIRLNGREYRQGADGLAIIAPRTVLSIKRDAEPGKIFQIYFQPHQDAAYPLLFDPVFPAGELADGLDLLFCRAFDRLLLMRSHTACALWSTLCHFGRVPTESERPADIQRVEMFIDENLAENFSIGQLAEEVGISHSTLIRLAKEHWGMPPLEYVRSRRLEKAAQLLVGSSLSIKQVAVAVGIPDLHRFNKLVRAAFQASPRKLRESSPVLEIHEQRRKL